MSGVVCGTSTVDGAGAASTGRAAVSIEIAARRVFAGEGTGSASCLAD